MSRPCHQDGWITEKAGNYYGHFNRYIFDPTSGEKERKHKAVVLGSKSAMRKWEAKAKLKGIIADELGGEQSITRPDPATSFEWFVENRFIPMRRGGWRAATKKYTEYEIRHHLVSRFGHLALQEIDQYQLQIFVNELAEKFSNSTVQKCHTRLKAIMRLSRKLKYILEDPAEDLRMPQTRKTKKLRIASDQIVCMLENIEHPGDKCLFAIGAFCALRTSEIFGLRWKYHKRDHFAINDTAWQGTLYEDSVKTDDSNALVFIPDGVRPLIAAWHALCSDISPEALMFATNGRGRNRGKMVPFAGNFLRRRIYPIAERLGIDKRLVTFQALRRTAATDLQKFGTVKDIQSSMRHSTPITALAEYVQPIPESVREAINARTRAILGTPEMHKEGTRIAKRFRTPLHTSSRRALR
jgi:integrase